MDALFWEATKQFGLPVGLLLVAVVAVSRMYVKKEQEATAQLLKELAETKTERDYYRDRWIEAVGVAEVGEEATKRLAGGKRRQPGGR